MPAGLAIQPSWHATSAPVVPMRLRRFVFTATFTFLFAMPAFAESGDPALGQRLAKEWCGKCHATGLTGASPLRMAPPLRELHVRYNVEDLANSLAKGTLAGHKSMPVFRSNPDQITNLIVYLKTLEKH